MNQTSTQDELQQAINSITGAGSVAASAATPSVAAPEIAPEKDIPMPEIEPASPTMAASMKAMYGDPDLDRVKSNALSDLRPILDTVDIPAEKKFLIYKEIIELTDDKGCIEPAYNCVKNIADDKARAEALVYVVEAIDRLGVQMPSEAA